MAGRGSASGLNHPSVRIDRRDRSAECLDIGHRSRMRRGGHSRLYRFCCPPAQSGLARSSFYIASGVIIGVYAISVLLEVILLGYLFKPPESSYFMIHLITFLGFSVVLGLIGLAGKYAGAHEQKESDHLAVKKETVAWIGESEEN